MVLRSRSCSYNRQTAPPAPLTSPDTATEKKHDHQRSSRAFCPASAHPLPAHAFPLSRAPRLRRQGSPVLAWLLFGAIEEMVGQGRCARAAYLCGLGGWGYFAGVALGESEMGKVEGW